MPYIPHKVEKGKHYAVYTSSLKGAQSVKTKSALLREALKKAEALQEHEEWIDFVPGKFSLQLHGWLNPASDLKNVKQVEAVIKQALKNGKDPLKEVDSHKAKSHYDLRIKKNTSNTWFGLTFFSCPWEGSVTKKTLGSAKGYQILLKEGKKLQTFLNEFIEQAAASEGVAERRDRIEWMHVKHQWFKPYSPGNPTKKENAFMVAIEYMKPCVIHRRELDFIDATFFGNYLKGRYFDRLVARKLKTSELMGWQKQAIDQGKVKSFSQLHFYFWKAKQQWDGHPYTMEQVKKVALGKIELDKIPAPPAKGTSKTKKVEAPPEANKESLNVF